MIEMALVLLVASIALSALLGILQTLTQTRTNQINTEASEVMKTSAIMEAIKNKSVSITCGPGSCAPLQSALAFIGLGSCVVGSPCMTYTASYPVPVTVTSQKDFWGNNMTYAPNVAVPSVSSATPPGTTVFTITSNGPNTTVGGGDDISYVVTAAEFIARVSRTGL